jgi:site-specific recombinase XerD
MNALVPGYLEDLHNKGKSPETIANYRQRVNAFLRWREDRPLNLRLLIDYAIHLQTRHTGREGEGCRPRTVHGHFAALANFWKYARTEGYRDLPPIKSVSLPRLDPERNVMPTSPQVDAMITASERVGRNATDPLYADYQKQRAIMIITLGLDLGLRRSEMRNLDMGDLLQDKKGRHLRIRRSKGGVSRTIPIPDSTWVKIEGWLAVREARCKKKAVTPAALLLNPQCYRIGDRSIDKALSDVLLLAGLENSGITPHSLRHGCATQLLRRGVDPVTVQEILGHSNLETTFKYLHTDYDTMQDAMNRLVERGGEKPPPRPERLPQRRDLRRSGGLRRTGR